MAGLSVRNTRGTTSCFCVEREPYDAALNLAGITEGAAWALPQEYVDTRPIRRYLLFRVNKVVMNNALARVGWTVEERAPGLSCIIPNESVSGRDTPVAACMLVRASLSQSSPVATPQYGAPEALRATEPLWEFDGVVIRGAHAHAVWEALDDCEASDPLLLTVVYALLHVSDSAGAEPSIAADMLCQTVVVDEPFTKWFSLRAPSEQSFIEACLEVYGRVATVDGLLQLDAVFGAINKLRSIVDSDSPTQILK